MRPHRAMALKAGGSAPAPTAVDACIRRYQASDHPRIEAITANVYGGTDMLAWSIKHELAHNPAAIILVVQPPDLSHVAGLVCAEERGSCTYLFGLRVAEEARGKGLAKQLMSRMCEVASHSAHTQHLLSTSIPENQGSVRVLTSLGFQHSRTVDRWPQEAPQFAYEAAVGFTPNRDAPEQPVAVAPNQPNMLDHIPGARQLVAGMTAASGVQPSDWVCCTHVRQLQLAVASIRQQQHQQQEQQELCPQLQQAPLDWLPWVYEVFPLQSQWVADRLAAGEVWLLPQPSSSRQPGGGCAACVVLSHAAANMRTCAGVLAAHDAAIAAAIEFVANRVPHFVAYVDSGTRHSSGAPDPLLQLPPVLRAGSPCQQADKEHLCFLVYSRPTWSDSKL